jgi:hypothetical protein
MNLFTSPDTKFDPQVVAEWDRRRSQHRRASQWLWYLFWTVLIVASVPMLLRIVDYFPYGIALLFCTVAAASMLRLRYLAILKCPHCEQTPVGRLEAPLLTESESCPHCHYWLLHPSLDVRFADTPTPNRFTRSWRAALNMRLPLRFPFLHMAKAVLSAAAGAGFFSFVSFFVAVPVIDGTINGVHVSPLWEAAVNNHGHYYQWLLLDRHRLLFGTVTLLWLICLTVLGIVERQSKRAEATDRARGRFVYWAADFLSFIAFGVTAWYFVFMPHG